MMAGGELSQMLDGNVHEPGTQRALFLVGVFSIVLHGVFPPNVTVTGVS
jgi:hypothetical protein